MADLDFELVRHALDVARDHGFAEVELGEGLSIFHATLSSIGKAKPASASPLAANGTPDEGLTKIKSPLVGYYRPGALQLASGQKIEAGEVVAVIAALGIANDVESKSGGEIVEVFVSDGDPVEFGQVLATVRSA